MSIQTHIWIQSPGLFKDHLSFVWVRAILLAYPTNTMFLSIFPSAGGMLLKLKPPNLNSVDFNPFFGPFHTGVVVAFEVVLEHQHHCAWGRLRVVLGQVCFPLVTAPSVLFREFGRWESLKVVAWCCLKPLLVDWRLERLRFTVPPKGHHTLKPGTFVNVCWNRLRSSWYVADKDQEWCWEISTTTQAVWTS